MTLMLRTIQRQTCCPLTALLRDLQHRIRPPDTNYTNVEIIIGILNSPTWRANEGFLSGSVLTIAAIDDTGRQMLIVNDESQAGAFALTIRKTDGSKVHLALISDADAIEGVITIRAGGGRTMRCVLNSNSRDALREFLRGTKTLEK